MLYVSLFHGLQIGEGKCQAYLASVIGVALNISLWLIQDKSCKADAGQLLAGGAGGSRTNFGTSLGGVGIFANDGSDGEWGGSSPGSILVVDGVFGVDDGSLYWGLAGERQRSVRVIVDLSISSVVGVEAVGEVVDLGSSTSFKGCWGRNWCSRGEGGEEEEGDRGNHGGMHFDGCFEELDRVKSLKFLLSY